MVSRNQKTAAASTAGQLSLNLPVVDARGHEDFLVAACNEEAVRWINSWPDWPKSPAWRGLILVGPPASGKSHLAEIWRTRSGAGIFDLAATADLYTSDRAQDGQNALLLNDVESVLAVDQAERAILHAGNALSEAGGTFLITAQAVPRNWAVSLPDLRSRLLSLPVAMIGAPDDTVLTAVLVKQFADRQVEVSAELVAYLLPRMERSFAAVRDIVERLDRASLDQKKAITIPLARSVLEGDAG
ncbi:MAG: DnaA/Hda family protein [Pseudomonadota bacterium]